MADPMAAAAAEGKAGRIAGFLRLRLSSEAGVPTSRMPPPLADGAAGAAAGGRAIHQPFGGEQGAAAGEEVPTGAVAGRREAEQELLFPELGGVALIRELHVYGKLVPSAPHAAAGGGGVEQALEEGDEEEDRPQHSGLGRRLMERAETIAWDAGHRRAAVISGVGARNYYRKLGYELGGVGACERATAFLSLSFAALPRCRLPVFSAFRVLTKLLRSQSCSRTSSRRRRRVGAPRAGAGCCFLRWGRRGGGRGGSQRGWRRALLGWWRPTGLSDEACKAA